MRHPKQILALIVSLGLLSGCAAPQASAPTAAQPTPPTPRPTQPIPTRETAAQEPTTDGALLTWQQRDGACASAQIGLDGVRFGPCGGEMRSAAFVSPIRLEQLRQFAAVYAPFKAETKAGGVEFNGQGSQTATPAEQRSLAEWAHLVWMEAEGGRGGAAWGLALAWSRKGGIAGFCDDLGVYLSGEVIATSCQGGQAKELGRSRLSAAQLEQLYAWVDSLGHVDYAHTDPATADAMSVTLIMNGAGKQPASPEQVQAMQDFAARVYTSAARGK